jgi:hypothetical protein
MPHRLKQTLVPNTATYIVRSSEEASVPNRKQGQSRKISRATSLKTLRWPRQQGDLPHICWLGF